MAYSYENKEFNDGRLIVHKFKDEDGELHRKDGPALICYYHNCGLWKEYYCKHGKSHNLYGPAIIHYDKDGNIFYREYWINGMEYEEFDFCVQSGIEREKLNETKTSDSN